MKGELPAGPMPVGGAGVLETVRSRIWLKALDGIVSSQARSREGIGADIGVVLRPRSAHYRRVQALCGLGDRLAPPLTRALRRQIWRTGSWPFACGEVTVIGWGSGGTVFRVTGEAADLAVKVYRNSLGGSPPTLRRAMRFIRGVRATIESWYDAAREILQPTTYAFVRRPVAGAVGVASIQPYLDPPHRDLFLDHDDDQWGVLAEASPTFRDQLTEFARATIRAAEEDDRIVDCAGRGNVAIVAESGDPRLRLIDHGIFALHGSRQPPQPVRELMGERLDRLRAFLERGGTDA